MAGVNMPPDHVHCQPLFHCRPGTGSGTPRHNLGSLQVIFQGVPLPSLLPYVIVSHAVSQGVRQGMVDHDRDPGHCQGWSTDVNITVGPLTTCPSAPTGPYTSPPLQLARYRVGCPRRLSGMVHCCKQNSRPSSQPTGGTSPNALVTTPATACRQASLL
jgi:hypothetical protein